MLQGKRHWSQWWHKFHKLSICDVLNEKQIVQSKILMTQSAKHRVEVTRESLLRNLWKSVSITIHMHTLWWFHKIFGKLESWGLTSWGIHLVAESTVTMSHTTLDYKKVDLLACAFVTYYVELDQAAKEPHYLAEVPYMNSKPLQSANKEATTQSEVHVMYKKRV